MGPIEIVIYYSFGFLYLLFKFVVFYHSIKNHMGIYWTLAVILPLVDFYYYFKYVQEN